MDFPLLSRSTTPASWHEGCASARCERLAGVLHELRQPASSLALLLAVLEQRTRDPALVPTLRAAQGVISRLGVLFPDRSGHCGAASIGSSAGAVRDGWAFACDSAQVELWPLPMPAVPRHENGAPGARAPVLLVEDHADVADALSTLLQDAGHTVLVAADADAALVELDAGVRIRAVISDLCLPGATDGIGVLCFARERHPDAALVLMTGDAAPEVVRTARRLDLRLLRKPLRADELIAALAN